MSHFARHAFILIAAVLLSTGCTSGASDGTNQMTSRSSLSAEASAEMGANDEHEVPTLADINPYSPYGVRVFENSHFDVVTFKDVGVSHFSNDRSPLLESIAVSLATNMSIDPTMPYRAHLVHNEKFADPDSHVYCDMNHIYVDLWTATAPDRFGYSLWSGCNETDQFAWEELPMKISGTTEYFTAVEVLTGRIADKIRDADHRDCFTQTC